MKQVEAWGNGALGEQKQRARGASRPGVCQEHEEETSSGTWERSEWPQELHREGSHTLL